MTPTCSDCGKQISRSNQSGKCWNCRFPAARRQELLALHNQGMSYGAIAERYGMTKTAVHSAVRKERGELPYSKEEPTPETEKAAARIGSANLLDALDRYWLARILDEAA